MFPRGAREQSESMGDIVTQGDPHRIEPELSSSTCSCLNCGAELSGPFCSTCGQKHREGVDRSLASLLKEAVTTLFLVDGRLVQGLWLLFARPGQLSLDHVEGRRRRHLTPISLFLIANLLFFLSPPISDFSLTAWEQLNQQPYSGIASELFDWRARDKGLSTEALAAAYDSATTALSKSMMILNVPLMGLFVMVIACRRRPWFHDSLIFTLHFMTALLLFMVLSQLLFRGLVLLPTGNIQGVVHGVRTASIVSILLGPLAWLIFGLRRFLAFGWRKAIAGALFLMLGLIVSQFMFRALSFVATLFWI